MQQRNDERDLLTARDVRDRYNISDVTLWRWERETGLGFPAPVRVRRRKYWRLGELLEFERAQQEAEA